MSRLINVSDELYEKLRNMKGERSFTFVIMNLLGDKSNKEEVLKRFGKGDVDEKRMKELRRGWKKWSEKYV